MSKTERESGNESSSGDGNPVAEAAFARGRYRGFLHDSYLGDGTLLGLAEADFQKQALRHFDEEEPSVLA